MLNVNPTLSSKMSGTMTFSERKKFIDLKGLLFSLLLTLLASLGLSQQTETGSISGRINDPSGIAVPGAKVSLLREGETVPVATATTGPNGGYTLSQVLPGKYLLTAEHTGFLKGNPANIEVAPRKDAAADLTLARDPSPGGTCATNDSRAAQGAGTPQYYEKQRLKPADFTGAVDPGGYSAAGQAERTGRLLEGAAQLKKDPATDPSIVSRGPSGAESKALAEMELNLKKAVESEPQSFETNHSIGEFYIHVSKLTEAIPYLEKAYALNPSDYVNAYDLALADFETQNYAAARRQIRSMLQRQDAAELHNLLAEVEEKSGNYVEAANQYELAAHMEPSEKNIFDWGLELLRHQTLEPAIEVFRHGVERYPGSAKTWIGYGTALYSRGIYDEAVKAFSQATDVNPSDPRPYLFLAQVYSVSSVEARDVTEHLHRFAQLQPRNPQALYSYALALWKGERGQNAQADSSQIESLLKSAAELDPRYPDVHLQLGILYAERKDYPQAIEEYQRAIKLSPELADAHYRLAQACVRTGEKARAQEEFGIYERLHKQQLAETEKRRAEVKQFVYNLEEGPRP